MTNRYSTNYHGTKLTMSIGVEIDSIYIIVDALASI